MPDAKIIGSAPVLLVKDVQASADYYRDKLGFAEITLYGQPPNFCIARRDGITMMLAQVDEGATITPHWKVVKQMWNAYFWVDDAEAIYAEMIERGAVIDYKLHTKSYGVKEFGVRDLDDHDLAFGQVLENRSGG
jgi:catechol 2,3-dioxygenase-like lactoylglutathione lyase family enzyme